MDNDPVVKLAKAEGLVCITLDIHLWSGRKRLKKEDLLAHNPALHGLPPESLATLGSIKIADPKDLKPFLEYKREAEKAIKKFGLPLLGTMAIPEARLKEVYDKLSGLKAKFEIKSAELYNDFNDTIAKWRELPENTAWQNLITDIPTPEHVSGRLSFGFHFARVLAPSQDENSHINGQFKSQVTGLKGELFAEAAAEAKLLMDKYLHGKDENGVVKRRAKITSKTLGPLRRVSEKFKNFAFLDPSVEPIAKMVDHALSLCPKDLPIEGFQLIQIWTMAKVLSDPQMAAEAAQMVIDTTPAQALESFINVNASSPAGKELEDGLVIETAKATPVEPPIAVVTPEPQVMPPVEVTVVSPQGFTPQLNTAVLF